MKTRIISLLMALCLVALSLAACSSGSQQSAAQEPAASETASESLNLLDEYAKNPILFNTLSTGAFSTDPADAPTDEELAKMLDFAMSSFTGHGLTPWQFVVVRDIDAQKEIFGDGSVTGSAVVTPGTVAVLVYSDQLVSAEEHAEPYTFWYMQTDNAVYDVGAASALFNVAANTLGYKTHPHLILNLPKDSNSVYQADKFLTSKDGKVDFAHTVGLYSLDGQSKEVTAKGNLRLYCAILVGKADKTLDAAAAATTVVRGKNYNFWEPQDGATYGCSVPAGQASASAGNPWDGAADGTYTGKGKSDSAEYTVAATVAGGKLTSIEITEGKDKMYSAGTDKVDTFIASVISAQSLTVDTVSGATQDCNGIVSAINEAFKK